VTDGPAPETKRGIESFHRLSVSAQVNGVNTMMAPARTPMPRSSQNVVRRIMVYMMTMPAGESCLGIATSQFCHNSPRTSQFCHKFWD